MPSLERFNVSRTRLTDDSAAAIRHLSSLKSLNILSTDITNSGLQQLNGKYIDIFICLISFNLLTKQVYSMWSCCRFTIDGPEASK